MPKEPIKKPTIDVFKKALEQSGGNLTQTAKACRCDRTSIWHWCKKDPEFKQALEESRKATFDSVMSTALVVAKGIPIIENGKVVGWQERPDSNMLKYFMQTLGRDEGFGEQAEITHKVEKGISVSSWIEQEMRSKNETEGE